jgi:hypothetical protein
MKDGDRVRCFNCVVAGYSGKMGTVVTNSFPVFPKNNRIPVKFDHDGEVLWLHKMNLQEEQK